MLDKRWQKFQTLAGIRGDIRRRYPRAISFWGLDYTGLFTIFPSGEIFYTAVRGKVQMYKHYSEAENPDVEAYTVPSEIIEYLSRNKNSPLKCAVSSKWRQDLYDKCRVMDTGTLYTSERI
jgi:hypothetical protein